MIAMQVSRREAERVTRDAHQTLRPFRVSAVLFDFDDTLTAPGALDFEHIRRELGCPLELPILEYVASLPEAARRKAEARLAELELEAAGRAQPNPAADEVVRRLRAQGLPLGILTRNGRGAVERALQNFPGLAPTDFDVIVSRDDPGAPKPAPDGVVLAAARLGVDPSELLVVGDYVFDILAGSAAGAVTALLLGGDIGEAGYGARRRPKDPLPRSPAIGALHADGRLEPAPDIILGDLAQLPEVVRLGRPLPAGKFPSDLLEHFLASLPPEPPTVLLGPRVGRDVATIDVTAAAGPGEAGAPLLAVGTDPVTFPTDALGRWSVLVNANDIATCGAAPRWLWATFLFPVGTTPSAVLAVLNELRDACEAHGIALCGGHTEITDAVTRPVVSATTLGTVSGRGLVDKRAMRDGDAVLLTKRVAVEGTALLAAELRAALAAAGMSDEELDACTRLRAQLSVVEEAAIAARFDGVSAMHDVTEGGLASAVAEFAAAGGHGVRIHLDAIPYFEETVRLCGLLGIDPLGLIGSGSLLIACSDDQSDGLIDALRSAGIETARIGHVLEVRPGLDGHNLVEALREGRPHPWPQFEVDEVARVLSGTPPRA
jgi:hydrogenase expression/formation protein HypE